MHRPHPPVARCLLLWSATTALAGLAHRVLAADALDAVALLRGTGGGFEEVLVGGCSLVVLACAAWGWLLVSLVALEALAGVRFAWVPGFARRAVLAACGVAVVGGLAGTAAASVPDPVPASGAGVLAGLPLPDRATGGIGGIAGIGERQGPDAPVPAMTAHTVVVAPGDSLWSLARADLVAQRAPSDSPAVEAHVRRLHELNRDRIGPDPDVIHPGQRLRMPR
ncbi:LysM peptidoglycan-binding domain-containing protein [Nocardioides sp. zg-DK7169]|uniref:LysM peptidoglycan-binding domain-containing protein n=1 Tax=Nocardioides sp. zg-DK7169 TaxID=2736600 RepID=UPI001556CA3A|nr:LysM peptidoglycan-binding domain-containing protein [Nocardioides sp. zg-DK7169]NPC95940.1 LysM peptidoglycan-binding domain-containing protein [Nocardioides sp. zg-DK7169]